MVCLGKGDVTFSVTDEDLVGLLTGKLNPQQVCADNYTTPLESETHCWGKTAVKIV